MTRILVCTEQYGNRYFDASTDEKWAEACLRILRDRLESGAIYRPEMPKDRKYFYTDAMREAVELTEEQLNALPHNFRESAKALRAAYFSAAKESLLENEMYDEIKHLVDTNDTSMATYGRPPRTEPLAWQYLNHRADYEYENVSLEELE